MKNQALTFKRHVHAHEAVVANRFWYGDGSPSFSTSFTAEKTAYRHREIVDLIHKASDRAKKCKDNKSSTAYFRLADKFDGCTPRHRCGSLACPKCARAFQKAKAAAQDTAISNLQERRPNRTLVFVTIIPHHMGYLPGRFSDIEILKANRWLKDKLKPLGKRIVVGSTDLGWETRRGGQYLQLHWHLALWTRDPDRLEKKLKAHFKRSRKYERHVDVTVARDLGFLPYLNKAIKLPELLRGNKTHLPELLLFLDQTPPMDLMILMGLRLSAQEGQLILRQIKQTKK